MVRTQLGRHVKLCGRHTDQVIVRLAGAATTAAINPATNA
jgi:hypothetical protein